MEGYDGGLFGYHGDVNIPQTLYWMGKDVDNLASQMRKIGEIIKADQGKNGH